MLNISTLLISLLATQKEAGLPSRCIMNQWLSIFSCDQPIAGSVEGPQYLNLCHIKIVFQRCIGVLLKMYPRARPSVSRCSLPGPRVEIMQQWRVVLLRGNSQHAKVRKSRQEHQNKRDAQFSGRKPPHLRVCQLDRQLAY